MTPQGRLLDAADPQTTDQSSLLQDLGYILLALIIVTILSFLVVLLIYLSRKYPK